ncbi:MAG: Bbp16 family capsid cement protein [Hyphomicrobium sp.]
MFIDKRLQVSSQQALTATAVSTDVIDLGSDRKIGPGEPMWLVVAFRVGLAGTSPTFAPSIQTDDNSGFSSATTLATGATLTAAPAGTLVIMPMPMTNERYLRANFTMGGTTPTATIDAWFTNQEPMSWAAQADAI